MSDVSDYAPPLRPIARVSSVQSLGSRRFSFDSIVKPAPVRNIPAKGCNIVKQQEVVRNSKIYMEQEKELKPLITGNQQIENLNVKVEFVPNVVAKYEEVRASEEPDVANVIERKPVVIDSSLTRKTPIKVEEPKKDVKFFLEQQNAVKNIEKKDVVKQEFKTAKDEMKAALEAGINYSTQEIDDEVICLHVEFFFHLNIFLAKVWLFAEKKNFNCCSAN